MEPWIQQAMVAHSPLTLPSGSVPTVSPFKYVIVLALSIRKNSPYLNKKKKVKKKQNPLKLNMLCQVVCPSTLSFDWRLRDGRVFLLRGRQE